MAATAAVHMLGVTLLPLIARWVGNDQRCTLIAEHREGHGALRHTLGALVEAGIPATFDGSAEQERPGEGTRTRARIIVRTPREQADLLAASLADHEGVVAIRVADDE